MIQNFLIEAGLYLTYLMLAVALLAVIITSILSIYRNFKKATIGLYVLLGFILTFAASCILSSNELHKNLQDAFTSRLVGGGLIMLYTIFACSVLAIIYSEIARKFK